MKDHESICGYEPGSLKDRHFRLDLPGHPERFGDDDRRGLTDEPSSWRVIRRDGTVRHIQTSEILYRSFLGASPDPSAMYDMDGAVRYVNHAFEKTFGWTRDELRERPSGFVPPEHRFEAEEAFRQLQQGRIVGAFETRRLTKNGDLVEVHFNSARCLDHHGNQTGFIVILRDISELKRAQYALVESEGRFATTVEGSPYGIALIGWDGVCQYLNGAFTEIFGYTMSDMSDGRDPFDCDFLNGVERMAGGSVWASGHRTWMRGGPKPCIRKVMCKNGARKIICFRPAALPNGDWLISCEDITERAVAQKRLTRAEKELKRSRESLKSVERIKEKAVCHLRHELKTPVAIIDAVFRILSKRSESDIPINLAEIIGRGQRHLQRLKNIQAQMDDIVLHSKNGGRDGVPDLVEDLKLIKQSVHEKDMSAEDALCCLIEKIESIYGPHKGPSEKIDLSDLVGSQVKNLQIHYGSRNLTISAETCRGMTICIDRAIISKVIHGLLKNAIENTPDGGLVVVRTQETGAEYVIEISDSGAGITEENQKNLFWGFFHAQDTNQYSTKKPGDFNAGGCGADLLRMKLFADRLGFSLSFKSRRCKHIPLEEDSCPGSVAKCRFIRSEKDCMNSGGSRFRVAFPKEKFSAPA